MNDQLNNCYTKRIREIFDIEKLQAKVNQVVYDVLEGFEINADIGIQIEEMVSGGAGNKIVYEIAEIFDIELPAEDDDDSYLEVFINQYEPCLNEALCSIIHIPKGFRIFFDGYDADGSYGVMLFYGDVLD